MAAAALLRSSVGRALRRVAAAPASSTRLSSAGGAASGNSTRVRTMHYDYSGGWRSRYDAEAYSRDPVPHKPELDKFDGYFCFAATIGAGMFVWLLEGDYWGWRRMNNTPRMTSRRGR